jgi:uncharacterized protein YegL
MSLESWLDAEFLNTRLRSDALKTLICLILDRSGSMELRQSDVVGGVNKFIKDQQELKDPASLAIVRFDDQAIERFRDLKPIADVAPLRKDEYVPRGWTPLLDAVGSTVAKLDEDWKAEKPDRCIVVIFTDGQENHSREYTKQKVCEMIQAREKSGFWSFIYVGANVDAFAEAGSMGISMANTTGYTSSAAGTAKAYNTVSDSVSFMRSTGAQFACNLGVANLGEDPDAHGSSKPDPKPTAAPAPSTPFVWTPPTSAPTSGGSTTWSPPT